MSASAAPSPHAGGSHWGPGRILGIITGSLIALVAGALATAGLAMVIVHLVARDDDGYINSPERHFTTPAYALTVEEIQMGDMHGGAGDWAVDNLGGRVRVRADLRGDAPVFVGIAREADLDRYLHGVVHDEIVDFGHDDEAFDTLRTYGRAQPAAPGDQDFWVAKAEGRGAQVAEWKPSGGEWAGVVMRADGARGIDGDVRIGAKVGWMLWMGLALLAVGSVGFFGGAALIALSGRRDGGAAPPAAGSSMSAALTLDAADRVEAAATARQYPVQIRAQLDEPLSRWLWIVKWALVIPHLIVLTFLWAAYVLCAIGGITAAILTGTYPRALFDFMVGVMRWSWRVELYANGAFATDRYPPFSLAADPSYPADVEIPYPETISRAKIGFQWLLALPHWLIIGALVGGGWWYEDLRIPGLLPILIVIAVVTLLFTGRYPRDLFRLIVGIHRWVIRTVAYAAGLRSEYPPFSLDR